MATNPTNSERALATETLEFLSSFCPALLKKINNGELNITIEEEAISFSVPRKAFNALIITLESMSQGSGGILTTQQVATRLNVSRPFVVKLLESGVIAHVKVGKHRRVKLSDLLAYKRSL
jgi:excisionase family DNA binding protein